MKNSISRKDFIRLLGGFIMLPVVLLLTGLVKRNNSLKAIQSVMVKIPDSDGIEFHERFIISRHGEDIKVLSNRCPHLGCRIQQIKDESIICPCHGSAFSKTGKVQKGPAKQNLEELDFNRSENTLTVYIES